MAINGVQSTLKNGVLKNISLGAVANVGIGYFDYKSRIKQGQNPAVAGVVAAGSAALGLTMGVVPYMLVTSGYGLAKAGASAYYSHYQSHGAYTRRMTMPFSHSFSHTDATYQMQQRGLQALGQSRGALGAEAGMMAQMYGRR